MGYPRFILLGTCSTEWFKPDSDQDRDWFDHLFTGLSSKEYWGMNAQQLSEHGLPMEPICRWFGFRFTGVASTSGVMLSSHCNYYTSSEPTQEQLEFANKIGHITKTNPLLIVESGLGGNKTERDVQSSPACPQCFSCMPLLAPYNQSGRRLNVIGKHLRAQPNGHCIY